MNRKGTLAHVERIVSTRMGAQDARIEDFRAQAQAMASATIIDDAEQAQVIVFAPVSLVIRLTRAFDLELEG